MNSYVCDKATVRDLEAILLLLKNVAEWLHVQEIDQWGFLLNGGEDDEIKTDIAAGKVYAMREDQEIIGTFTLSDQPNDWDLHIWQAHEEGCVYLHRLAVDRKYSGNQIGQQAIAYIEKLAIQMEKKLIKLDCVGTNSRLNQFYLDNGYQLLGTTSDGHSKYIKRL